MTAKDEARHTEGEIKLKVGDFFRHIRFDGRCGAPHHDGCCVAEIRYIEGHERFGAEFAERLARAWNSLSPNEARIAELEEALREVATGLLENIEETAGSVYPDVRPPEPATERDVALVNLLGIVRAALEPARAEGSHD